MRRTILVLTVWSTCIVLFPATLIAGALADTEAVVLKSAIQGLGIKDVTVEINVPISVPAKTRINNLGVPEVMPAVTLWGALLKPTSDPLDNTPRTTILISTCYRREITILLGMHFLVHGYNVFCFDIRGSGSSEGSWSAFGPPEHHDVAYVVDKFIPSQPWSNGLVGMYGPSYLGITQFLAAGLCERNAAGVPTHLKALFPFVPMSDPYRIVVAHGGNMDFEFMAAWLVLTDLLTIMTPVLAGDPLAVPTDAGKVWLEHWNNIATTVGWVMDPEHIYYCDWYKQKSAALYFPVKPKNGWVYDTGVPIEEGTHVIPAKLPVFMVGGWYDIFTMGTSECYQYGLANQAVGDKAMVIGPWYHATGAFGLGLNDLTIGNVAARWFDWKIQGKIDPFMSEFPVLLYVMGEDRWRAEKTWPLASSRTQSKTYCLSKRAASKVEGDWFATDNAANNYALVDASQVSSLDYPASVSPVLKHDPTDLHGLVSRSDSRWLMGMLDMFYDIFQYMFGYNNEQISPYEDERKDEVGVLTFSTDELQQDVEIVGPMTLTFWASTKFTDPLTQDKVDDTVASIKKLFNISDGNLLLDLINRRDVQWVVELNDVFEGGRARNITSGWLGASQRPYDPKNPTATDPGYKPFYPYYYQETFNASHPQFSMIDEGTVYRYVVELWPTCNVFKAGHRIRVSISNSDVPHLLPYLIPSDNTLVIDSSHPAKLDFTTTTATGQDSTWKWITATKGTVYQEFAAANTYLMEDTDPATASSAGGEESSESSSEQSKAASSGSDGGGSSGGCFISCAML